MSKFVCEACGGQSDVAKVCETPGCSMNGQPLKEALSEDVPITGGILTDDVADEPIVSEDMRDDAS